MRRVLEQDAREYGREIMRALETGEQHVLSPCPAYLKAARRVTPEGGMGAPDMILGPFEYGA